MNLINSTPAAIDLTSILDDMSSSLLKELTQLEGDLTNENVITFLKTASSGAMLYNWMIGRVLVKVEEAISSNTPGFNYNSMSEWFDDFEDELPFKRSAAKQYKDIAKSFTIEQFSCINYTKAKTI